MQAIGALILAATFQPQYSAASFYWPTGKVREPLRSMTPARRASPLSDRARIEALGKPAVRALRASQARGHCHNLPTSQRFCGAVGAGDCALDRGEADRDAMLLA